MKRIKNLVMSYRSIVALIVCGPVAVCVSSIVRAIEYGYSCERPLISLIAVLAVALALYYPVAKAKTMDEFNLNHEFEFGQRAVIGWFFLVLIAIIPETYQMKEYVYDNHIMLWLFNVVVAVFLGFWGLVILFFVFDVGPKEELS